MKIRIASLWGNLARLVWRADLSEGRKVQILRPIGGKGEGGGVFPLDDRAPKENSAASFPTGRRKVSVRAAEKEEGGGAVSYCHCARLEGEPWVLRWKRDGLLPDHRGWEKKEKKKIVVAGMLLLGTIGLRRSMK